MVEEDPVEEGADAEDSNSDQDQESNAGVSLKQVCVGRQDRRGQGIIVTECLTLFPVLQMPSVRLNGFIQLKSKMLERWCLDTSYVRSLAQVSVGLT